MEIYENLDLQDLENEVWKEIEGYNGDYYVSNYGRVKSFKRYHGTDVRILEQIENKEGYLCIGLYKNGEKPKTKQIHTLMFETHIEKIPKGYVVHHIDFTKNNFLENFQVMTRKEHMGLHRKGENHPMFGKDFSGENGPNHTLTEQKVIQIRIDLKEGILTQKEIGKKFGVHKDTISKIKTGKRWKHIK